jgi:MoaA/NifB/PqqE/SkfB family radical SAM enzyme
VASEEISGISKYLLFSKVFFGNKEFRSLPLKFHWYLAGLMKYEKVVKKGGKFYILSQMPSYPSHAFERYVKGLCLASAKKHKPISLEFAITNHCPCNCWHCSNAYREGKDLSLKKVQQLLRGFVDLGVTWIGLSGGEPLMRSDLEEIISCVGDDAAVALFTTGVTLKKERVKKLKKAGLTSFVVSLDSSKAKVHDKLRGTHGAYKAAMNTIKWSNEAGLYTVVSTVATRSNVSSGEMEKFLLFCKEKGVDEVRILALAATGKLIEGTKEAMTDREVKELKRLHKEGNRSPEYPKIMAFPYLESPEVLGCAGGFHHFTMDAQGNVCPCPFLAMGVGNAVDEGVEGVVEKYRKLFKQPHSKCINTKCHNEIHKASGGKLPLGYKECKKIYKSLDPGEMPGFYKALRR